MDGKGIIRKGCEGRMNKRGRREENERGKGLEGDEVRRENRWYGKKGKRKGQY